jgi:hypothetical protein
MQMGQSKSMSLFSAELTMPEKSPIVGFPGLDRLRLLELLLPAAPDMDEAIFNGTILQDFHEKMISVHN